MGIPLVEALEQVDLEVGRTYRCHVKGRVVELRVLEAGPASMAPAPIDESDIMLDPWVDLPRPAGGVCLHVKPGKLPRPDVPDIPRDDEGS
jgi:hypothetical protein